MEPAINKINDAMQSAHYAQGNADYLRMLDDSPVYFSAFLPDGTLTFVNELLARTTGRERDELIGLCFYDMLPPDEAATVRERISSLSPDRPSYTHTQVYTTPDGSRRWQQWTNRAFFDEHGQPIRYQAVGQDITESKIAEDELKRQATLLDVAHDSILVRELDDTITYWNQGAVKRYGWSKEEALGRKIHALLQTQFPTPLGEIMGQLHATDLWEGELTHVARDGSHLTVASRWVLQRDVNDAPMAILEINNDITEQKRVEESIQHLSSFPKLNPNPVIEMNRHGVVTYSNPSAMKVLETIGSDLTGISAFFPDDLQSLLSEWDGQEEKLYSREVEIDLRVFAETIHLVPVVEVARIDAIDITRQKQIERQLKISEENYRNFATLTSDLVHRCSRTGDEPFHIQWMGGSLGSLSGYSIEEITAAGCFLPFIHREDREYVADELIGMAPGDVKILEFRLVTKQGEMRWIAEKCRCVKGDKGGELILFGSIRDVTERKEMEETLRLTFAELKRHDTWMVMLNQMNDMLISADSREEAYAIISNSAEKLFSPYSGGLAICSEGSSELEVVVCWGEETGMNLTFPMSDCWALRRRSPHKIEDPSQFLGCKLYQGPMEHPHFCMPLMAREKTLGLLQIIASESTATKQFDEMYNLAITMSESITLALSNLLLREALREEAIHDPLTGLFNRRYLEETLALELLNHQRTKEPLTVAMLDLDHFKSFNDEYGHEAGDIVLKEIGALLRRSLRGGDIACRYGGEELTVILSGSTLENALPRLDNIRQMIMHLCLYCRNKELPPITVSIGMSEARPNETDVANLLRRADAALYQAKLEGRNKIVAAGMGG